jgi:large subunit ribosomal protein L9
MKVIFKRDVPKIGKKHQVKEVPNGYAVNFLFPHGHAILATPEAQKALAKEIAASEAEKKIQSDLLHKNLDTISKTILTLVSKANEKGHLFSGIHKEQIAAELKTQTHLEVPLHFIHLDKPLKEAGQHKVKIGTEEKTSLLTVEIQAEK